MASSIDILKTTTATKTRVITFVHEWAIDDFKKFRQAREQFGPLQSCKFPSENANGFQWRLLFSKANEALCSPDPIVHYLTLECVACPESPQSLSLLSHKLFVSDNDGSRNCYICSNSCDKPKPVKGNCGHCKLVINVSELYKMKNVFSASGSLTLGCEIKVLQLENVANLKEIKIVPSTNEFSVTDHIEKLLLNPKLSDVTFKVGNAKLPAHKVILAARSAVFCDMFTPADIAESGNKSVEISDTDVTESGTKCVEISDTDVTESGTKSVESPNIDVEAMKIFLQFIYTDRTSNLGKWACQLITLADKYGIKKLKVLAENELIRNVGVDNVIEALVLSDLHDNAEIRDAAMEFLMNHFEEVAAQDEWNEFKTTYPSIVHEIMVRMSKNLNKGFVFTFKKN